MIIQLSPAIPLNSPKGPCLAHFLIDNGIESDLQWVCFQDNTGECWTWSNKDIRAQKNITAGRIYEWQKAKEEKYKAKIKDAKKMPSISNSSATMQITRHKD